ncbi:MAG TPA: DUF2061 domain-containing protein [Candidatus Poseidoniales archaeon]|jgi:uncharacterized membrane protein|nr:MAG: hypothetical protein CXT65_04820 [Euryarchaeota archaeon]HIG38239.1 DUF2061 domain-containing protein [Candidatus Poseidoniales archaeon]HIL44136.1 DUF2061 domain-containing protein [Candidatus Poseidoniales archaeon]
MDSQKRTIVKTLLWRFIASGTTVVVVFGLSGNITLGLTAAAIGIPLKLFMYYFYERFWMKSIEWGKVSDDFPELSVKDVSSGSSGRPRGALAQRARKP